LPDQQARTIHDASPASVARQESTKAIIGVAAFFCKANTGLGDLGCCVTVTPNHIICAGCCIMKGHGLAVAICVLNAK